jgi:serine/threonine protein kinase
MQIPFEELERHCILGAGTFGKVWLVSRKGTNDAYALKVQVKRQLIEHHQAEGVLREKNIMAQLDSPFIISLSATYQDATSIYMLTKLYQGGELWSIIHTSKRDGLPEEAANFYLATVLEGLTHMHTRSIIFRDLKGENVLLDSDGYCVIIDLGFAKVVQGKTYTFCGTPLYLGKSMPSGYSLFQILACTYMCLPRRVYVGPTDISNQWFLSPIYITQPQRSYFRKVTVPRLITGVGACCSMSPSSVRRHFTKRAWIK